MSNSERIVEWKKEAEIDYLHPFIALWVAFDIWLMKSYAKPASKKNNKAMKDVTQRDALEELKNDTSNINGSEIYQKMNTYLNDTENKDSLSLAFKSNFILLSNALSKADILYDDKKKNNSINFQNGLLERAVNKKAANYIDIFKKKGSRNKIKISNDDFLIDDVEKISKIYLETLYLIRCKLFHGELKLKEPENKVVIKFLYLTLKDLMIEI